MSDENYVRVKAILVHIRPDAVLFDIELDPDGDDDGDERWIPKSLIHGGDLLTKIKQSNITEIVEFRLMEWKAKQLGL